MTPAAGLRTLLAPVSSDDSSEQIVVTNAGEGEAVVTFWAVDASGVTLSGTEITNPRTLNLQANQTSVSGLDQLLGAGVRDEPVASVQIETLHESVIRTLIGTAGGRRYASPLVEPGDPVYVPFERATAVDVPVVVVHNGGAVEATITTTLRDSTGALVATALTTLSAQGGVRSALSELFDLEAGALSFEGYVMVRGRDVWASILQNDGEKTAEVTVEAFSRAGAALGSTVFELGAGDLAVQLLRKLVPTALEHTDGYVKVTSDSGVWAVAYRGSMVLDELLVLEGQVTP